MAGKEALLFKTERVLDLVMWPIGLYALFSLILWAVGVFWFWFTGHGIPHVSKNVAMGTLPGVILGLFLGSDPD